MIVFAAFAALGGLVALLAGAVGIRRTRRILSAGESAMALVKRGPPGSERQTLQYETADGHVLEVISPVLLEAGTSVLLSYDPEDPREVVLPGYPRTRVDLGFVLLGLAVILAGAAFAFTAF
ncbi:hypothetical protein [Streptomyces sp. NPDC058280]|uniref:hypothetical protein n=1 Tax=Streptomyces sp. NPDC058280 TaxID=3346419 RepID=UPI0036E5B050